MNTTKDKKVLISGASIAGLSTAYWMNRLGYKVTVVEMADEPRTNGAAVDLREDAINIVKRMGIYEQLKVNRLNVERIEFKDANDHTVGVIMQEQDMAALPDDEIEIERDKFINILLEQLRNKVEFLFNNRITAMSEIADEIFVTLQTGEQRGFDLVLGCDGMHSGVRRLWFGEEAKYAHFLGAYSSITILDKLLIKQKTMQMFNVPGKAVMLNTYNGKTDVIFCFLADQEIDYDYRNDVQQRKIITDQFASMPWRTTELLEEMEAAPFFYFDKFCQIKMPLWTKGRVALVGDAAYCASPAAGMGASLSVIGAGTLADALQQYEGDFERAFVDYNDRLRHFIEEVQTRAELNVREHFIPRTEEDIRKRNAMETTF